jgi:putative thioredoxin
MEDMAYRTSGIVDLSTLAPQPPAPPGARYVQELTEQNFDQAIQQSMRYPIVVEFYSARAPESGPLAADLDALAAEAAGRFLLARVDVDAQPKIAGAFGVQAVPTVVAVLGGQVAPLFQGTASRAEIGALLDQVLQLAASNGVVGRADPVLPEGPDGQPEEVADPRFEAADAKLAEEDFEGAVAEFDKVLAQTPGDKVALAGKAQAGLLARVSAADQAAVMAAAADPHDVDAQLGAADIELLSGQIEAAFARLISVIRSTAGEDRDRARVRLLSLFDTMDAADPRVLKARRDLATALY